jgi:hypothetical protein
VTVTCARAEAARESLAAIPRLYVRLHLALGVHGGGADRAATATAAPLPIRLDAWTAMEDITRTVVSWHGRALLRSGARRCPDPRTAGPRQLGLSARWLAGAWESVTASDDGPGLCESLIRVEGRARHVLSLDKLVHPLPVPCPHCGGQLSRADGTSVVRCRGCRASWTEEMYRLLVTILAAELTGAGT